MAGQTTQNSPAMLPQKGDSSKKKPAAKPQTTRYYRHHTRHENHK